MEIDNDLLERGVAKERVAMFKNLQSGAQPAAAGAVGDSKLRVDVSDVPFSPPAFSRRILIETELFIPKHIKGFSMARKCVSANQCLDLETKDSTDRRFSRRHDSHKHIIHTHHLLT